MSTSRQKSTTWSRHSGWYYTSTPRVGAPFKHHLHFLTLSKVYRDCLIDCRQRSLAPCSKPFTAIMTLSQSAKTSVDCSMEVIALGGVTSGYIHWVDTPST